LVSHETASSSAECSRDKPPFSFVRGQDSTDLLLIALNGYNNNVIFYVTVRHLYWNICQVLFGYGWHCKSCVKMNAACWRFLSILSGITRKSLYF